MVDSTQSTIVGPSILINGNLQGDEDLTVLGRVEGTLSLTKTLNVAESGIVKADISVRNAVVSGGFESLTEAWGGFNVAGPNARELLGRLTDADLTNDAFRFMHNRKIRVAGIDAVAIRVSFSGDLGWEVYVPLEHQLELYQALLEQGADLGAHPSTDGHRGRRPQPPRSGGPLAPWKP